MELNFLFGNPVKGKKGGKRMAGRKRRSSARKNPAMIKGKWYFDEVELEKYREGVKGLKPKAKSSYSAADAKILGALGYSTAAKKGTELSYSAAKKLIKKLEHDKKLATPAEARKIDATIKKVEASVSGSTVEDALKRLRTSSDKSAMDKFSKMLSSRGPSAISKLGKLNWDDIQDQVDYPAGGLTEEHILDLIEAEEQASSRKGKAKSKAQELESLIRSMVKSNPSKGGKKMAKKKGKKATKRKVKKAGKKTVRKSKGKARKSKAKGRRSKRKVKHLALAKAAAKAYAAGEKSARSYFKKNKKAKVGPKKGKKAVLRWKRGNPGIKDAAVSIGKIALAGAAAGVALQLANKFAKPLIDKVVPSAIADLKIGNAPVGQILLSCLVPGLVAAGLKMVRHPMAQQVSDVIVVTTAANAGQRIVAGLMPAGMAGVEPMLMGVEPMLMGEADFGEADFGEADFGAIEQFSGVEPQLMGEADFGAIQQYSGYGAIEQFSGDEDYAGEADFGEDDMDGEHLG
jgi:hypothetical protein